MFSLNHEIVNRLLNKAKAEASSIEELENNRAIQELCGLWLQSHTLEWTAKIFERKDMYFSYNLIEVGSMECFGIVSYNDGKFSAVRNKEESVPRHFNNESDARKWLENEAIENGYAISQPYIRPKLSEQFVKLFVDKVNHSLV